MDAETFRALALAFPQAEEHPHFDRPSFRVRGRIFAVLRAKDAPPRVTLKLDRAAEEALTASAPETFQSPPGGWAGKGWTMVVLDRVDPEELRELLEDAWRGVAPKRLAAAYDA